MLEVHEITKRYGSKTAIERVSFRVEQGEVVGFLGVNGAGKSTTMNMITGYLSTTEGSITVDGFDVLSSPAKVKERLGYLPEIPPLYQDLTVLENLNFAYSLKKPRLNQKAHIDELCEMVQITDVRDRLVQNLSKGFRQRVGLAAALVGNPPILILDEPTVGLDPKQIIEIRELIKELAKTRTVVLSSHILPEVQAVCGRIIMIDHGHVVADDTPENLIAAQMHDQRIIVEALGDCGEIRSLLQGIETVSDVAYEPSEDVAYRFYLQTDGHDVRAAAASLLTGKGIPLLELRYKKPTLEDVFLSLTMADRVSPEEETPPPLLAEEKPEQKPETESEKEPEPETFVEGGDGHDSDL